MYHPNSKLKLIDQQDQTQTRRARGTLDGGQSAVATCHVKKSVAEELVFVRA
jgi:hypothetical protein